MALLLGLYRAATVLFGPASGPYLRRRAARGKEDAARLGERRGLTRQPRPAGPLVWLHGASVGESLALLPLVDALIARGFAVLVTTGTVSSARILATRLPPGALHQFVPLDMPGAVRRFLDHWRPQLAALAESELWPNLMIETTQRAIPLVLVNARLSRRSFARWRRLPRFIGPLLARVDLCLAQSAGDAERLAALGMPRVSVTGNLKFDAAPPPAALEAFEPLLEAVDGRPLWLAASTHEDEEDLVLATHRHLAERWPDLLTIVAPRQSQRGPALAIAGAAAGLSVSLRSRGESISARTGLYIADTMGELGLFYRLAPLVFVGKSLGGGGGQNPIEPAKLGCAILHGPAVANFVDIYRVLDGAGGAIEVTDGPALATALSRLLADERGVADMAEAAASVIEAQAGGTQAVMAALEPLLRRADRRPGET